MRRTLFLIASLSTGVLLFPCSIDPGPFFKPGARPEDEAAFAGGKLGLITPALDKMHELLAYRSLSGLTIDPARMKLTGNPATPPDYDSAYDGVEAWRNARATVSPPPSGSSFLTPFAVSRSSPNVYYENCLGDAFRTAAGTLEARRKTYRNESELSEWAQAQDKVFANCNGRSPDYPPEPGPELSAEARSDRLYQIAAAHFYAEDFEDAEKMFGEIARDRNSPWRQTAAYMVGRTLLREVSLQGKRELAAAAREQFTRIAADPAAGALRDSAKGLVEHLDAMVDAPGTLQSLAKQLMAPQPDGAFGSTLAQSRYVLLAGSFHAAIADPGVPEPFDWVRTLEAAGGAPEEHALARWRAAGSLPWLTLALIYADGKQPAAPELIAKADGISEDSPGFATVRYNSVRLLIERGEKDKARAQLDKLLAGRQSRPPSVLDAWRAERMRLATSFDDFLRWAPRAIVDSDNQGNAAQPAFDELDADSTRILDFETPLSMLAQAAHSRRLPAGPAGEVAMSAWTRAFILRDSAVMADMAPIVARAHPAWASQLTPSGNRDEWRFHAALLLARQSEFQPVIGSVYRNHFFQNVWWCPVNESATYRGGGVAWQLSDTVPASDAGIPPGRQKEAESEVEQLRRAGSAHAVLGPIILAWAASHPDDPSVPEALHRVVMVVRYGCHEDAGGPISKAAFELLHRKYPKSPWAAKTPYWFN